MYDAIRRNDFIENIQVSLIERFLKITTNDFFIGFSGHITLPVCAPRSVIAAVRPFLLLLVLNL
jgi:hypothetical protein